MIPLEHRSMTAGLVCRSICASNRDMKKFLEENPEAKILGSDLSWPICQDFEEYFSGALSRREVQQYNNLPLHVVVKTRAGLLVASTRLNTITVKPGLRSGIINDGTFQGFVAVPCGRDEEFTQRGFMLAREAGDLKVGADRNLIEGWLSSNGISASNEITKRISRDPELWKNVWHHISFIENKEEWNIDE